MNFPNWLRIVWWALLTVALTVFLVLRLPALIAGTSTPFDMLAFVVWVCLLLAPVFKEIELLGFKVKQEIAAVKEQVDGLRTEIRNSVEVRSQFNPQITLMAPPSDSQLPEIEKRLRGTLEEALKSYGLKEQPKDSGDLLKVPGNNVYFFEVRYSIEKELQRMWTGRFSYLRKLFAAGLLTCVTEFGTERDVAFFERKFWDLCD